MAFALCITQGSATHIADTTGNIKAAADWLGHTGLETVRFYAKQTQKSREIAMRALEGSPVKALEGN